MTRTQTVQTDSRLQMGNVTLDCATFELSTPAGSFRLANKEFQVLELLMRNPHSLIASERLLEKIWGYDSEAEINVVWVYILLFAQKTVRPARQHTNQSHPKRGLFTGGAAMIRKLRMKLIIASMVSLLAVLLVIMSAVNLVYLPSGDPGRGQHTCFAGRKHGFFPKNNHEPPPDEPFPQKKNRIYRPSSPMKPGISLSRSRRTGSVQSVNTGKIAAVDTSDAIDYAQSVWKQGKTQGFADQYRFLVDTSSSETLILFLDCSRGLDNFKTLLFRLRQRIVCRLTAGFSSAHLFIRAHRAAVFGKLRKTKAVHHRRRA